jgi:hypothetical protein
MRAVERDCKKLTIASSTLASRFLFKHNLDTDADGVDNPELFGEDIDGEWVTRSSVTGSLSFLSSASSSSRF